MLMKKKMKKCKTCGQEIARKAKICPHCGAKNKKPFYKRVFFWLILLILTAAVAIYGLWVTNPQLLRTYGWTAVNMVLPVTEPTEAVEETVPAQTAAEPTEPETTETAVATATS